MPAHLELTDERLVVRIGDEAVPRHDLPFHRITQVEEQVGLMTGYLTVSIGADRLVFARIPKADVRPMADALRALVAPPLAPPPAPPPDGRPAEGHAPTPLEELERLARLREAGMLTSDEYDEA